jgi:hypothetical protein
VYFELKPAEQPQAVLEGVQSAEEFLELVRRRGADDDGSEETVAPQVLVQGQTHPDLGNVDALFKPAVGTWTPEPHVHEDRRFLVLIQKHTPERSLTRKEAGARVASDYVARKRQELMQQLVNDLMTRYDVKVSPPQANAPADVRAREDDPAK